jgi:hypothetical protein
MGRPVSPGDEGGDDVAGRTLNSINRLRLVAQLGGSDQRSLDALSEGLRGGRLVLDACRRDV